MAVEPKRALIEPAHPELSIRRPCALVGLARSTLDDQPLGASLEHLQRMRGLDEPYTVPPFYGLRRMTAWLRGQGYTVQRKRVARLMRMMGLEALDPQPRLSQPAAGHTISPDLLRGITVDRVKQVGSADIPYSRLQRGVGDLVAVLDWFSRSVLAWALSMTLDLSFGVEARARALGHGCPEMFKTDQGGQCTRQACTARLKTGGRRISMDGRGRALDNVFVERLWRTGKQEEV